METHRSIPERPETEPCGYGRRPRPKGQPFTLIGADGNTYYPMTPRDVCLPPRESVNCHCLLQPVVSEEVLGLSLEERQALQAQAIAEDDGEWEKELDAQNKARAGINEEDYT